MNLSPITPAKPPFLSRTSLGASGIYLLAMLALLAASFCIYGQTLTAGFINFDDPGYVHQNPFVTGGLSWKNLHWAFTTFERANWHPLTWVSLMADAQFYGTNAGGYHLTNLLLHAANAALLFLWLKQATGNFWPSALTALFFVIHPLHVESVAWISERKDVLSMFFCCLTLLAYTRYARGGDKRFYGLSLALFALGLCAKPMLVTLPALLLLLDYWPLRRIDAHGRGFWRLTWEKAPFFLLVIASCTVTFVAQHQGGAVVPLEALPVGQRIQRALIAYVVYLEKTFWPLDLGVYYPYWPRPPLWQPAVCLALLAGITGATWRVRRTAPYALTGWCWFMGTLVPVIGIVQVGGQALADRYTYLPHVGLFILLCWAGAEGWRRAQRLRPWLAIGAAVGAAACLTLSCRQAAYWRDGATLFAHTTDITSNPTVRLYILYGDACIDSRRFDEAEGAYCKALLLQPGNPDLIFKLGYSRLTQGRWVDAAAFFADADRIRPGDNSTLCNLGIALKGSGRPKEAAESFQRCLRLHPDSAAAHLGLADAVMALGDTTGAAAQYEATLHLEADSIQALTRLSWLLATGGNDGALQNPARALALARKAVRLTQGRDINSLDALAAATAGTGHWAQAAEVAQAALLAAEQPGEPAALAEIRRERLDLYRAGQWPRR